MVESTLENYQRWVPVAGPLEPALPFQRPGLTQSFCQKVARRMTPSRQMVLAWIPTQIRNLVRRQRSERHNASGSR